MAKFECEDGHIFEINPQKLKTIEKNKGIIRCSCGKPVKIKKYMRYTTKEMVKRKNILGKMSK